MKYLATAFLLVLSISGYAQFGISANYTINDYKNWTLDDQQLIPNTVEVGGSYWFRLPNHRVEFLPELFYGIPTTYNFKQSQFSYSSYRTYVGARINTHVYPFDFENDCNCPTFSKQGPDFMKGFFFQFSGGVLRSEIGLKDISKSIQFIPEISLGVGYDIGINDLITVSPYASYGYIFDQKVAAFTDFGLYESSGNERIQAGIKVIFRTDYNSTPGWM